MMETNQKEVRTSQKVLNTLRVGTPGIHNMVLSGCKLMTLTFPDSASIDVTSISFVNKYTGTLTVTAKFKVSQKNSEGESSFKFEWKKLASKRLMPHPHFATGAESKFTLNKTDFLHEPVGICALKFTLHQPSVQFTEFSIENLAIFRLDKSKQHTDSLSEWITQQENGGATVSKHNAIKDLPPIDKISQVLQRMWALGKKASDLDHTAVDPNRFDKDGCYDISLLAY